MSHFAEALTSSLDDGSGETDTDATGETAADRRGCMVKVEIDEKVALAGGIAGEAKALSHMAVDLPGIKGVFSFVEDESGGGGAVMSGASAIEVNEVVASMLTLQRYNIAMAPDQFQAHETPEGYTRHVRDLAAKLKAAKKAS